MKKTNLKWWHFSNRSFVVGLAFAAFSSFTSCNSSDKRFDFKSEDDAISVYRGELQDLLKRKDCTVSQLADCIKDWQTVADTVYKYIKQQPKFIPAGPVSMQFIDVSDSINTEFLRLAGGDHYTMSDVMEIKSKTVSFKEDNQIRKVKNEASEFFDKLAKDKGYTVRKPQDAITGYVDFLNMVEKKGIQNKKDMLDFLITENKWYMTYLENLNELWYIQETGINEPSERISQMIYKCADENKIASEEILVYMLMRTSLRLIQNAEVCSNSIKENKVKLKEQGNVYIWMTVQPFMSIDQFGFYLLTKEQHNSMKSLAADYGKLCDTLQKMEISEVDLARRLPSQLLRLYISNL